MNASFGLYLQVGSKEALLKVVCIGEYILCIQA